MGLEASRPVVLNLCGPQPLWGWDWPFHQGHISDLLQQQDYSYKVATEICVWGHHSVDNYVEGSQHSEE